METTSRVPGWEVRVDHSRYVVVKEITVPRFSELERVCNQIEVVKKHGRDYRLHKPIGKWYQTFVKGRLCIVDLAHV